MQRAQGKLLSNMKRTIVEKIEGIIETTAFFGYAMWEMKKEVIFISAMIWVAYKTL
jgi:hypothetical protein